MFETGASPHLGEEMTRNRTVEPTLDNISKTPKDEVTVNGLTLKIGQIVMDEDLIPPTQLRVTSIVENTVTPPNGSGPTTEYEVTLSHPTLNYRVTKPTLKEGERMPLTAVAQPE